MNYSEWKYSLHLILDIMKIKSFKGGYDYNFSYLIWDEITLEGAIIDPAVQPDTVFDFISNNNIQLSKILITHTHHDHIVYLNDFYRNILISIFMRMLRHAKQLKVILMVLYIKVKY